MEEDHLTRSVIGIKNIVLISVAVFIPFLIITFLQDQQHLYRPFLSDIQANELIKVSDAFDQADIKYHVDPESQILYVDLRDKFTARFMMSELGLYSEFSASTNVVDDESCSILREDFKDYRENAKFYEKHYFIEIILALIKVLAIIAVFLITRPMLNKLIENNR